MTPTIIKIEFAIIIAANNKYPIGKINLISVNFYFIIIKNCYYLTNFN